MKRLFAIFGLLCLGACHQTPADVCIPPVAQNPAEKAAMANAVQSENPLSAMDTVQDDNASTDLEICLNRRAYEARHITGSVDSIASGVVAQCHDAISASALVARRRDAQQNKIVSHGDHELEFELDNQAGADAEKDAQRDALAAVMNFRACASGGTIAAIASSSPPR